MYTRLKKTYICKDVIDYKINYQVSKNYIPQTGDASIFEVMHIGKHRSVQSDSKRNVTIIPGDRIMAAFGTRYATAQFEGYVPENCFDELHILGAGGTVGVINSMHEKFIDVGPTKLRFIGLVTDLEGNVINTKTLKSNEMSSFTGLPAHATKLILSLGSSMDSGKTTSAAYLINGLKKAGFEVAYIKLTGTVYTKDCDLNYDLGADITADFGDFGFPSTYMCSEKELLDLYESLLKKVLYVKPDYVVLEIADGLYERETKMLLRNVDFMETIYGVIFSAGDSLSAINGVQVLRDWNIRLFAISGLLTASPLLIKEVKENTSLPVYTVEELSMNATEILRKNKGAGYGKRKLRKVS
ncbi:MAG: hypothetical protein EPN92_00890 [Chitinophagaceae bacterium]|nr:MAG: hypothetical protein EPN92_00890 [Chitinophagaceae bacterium]